MKKILKSEYIKYSRSIIKKLHSCGCYGDGSMYPEHIVGGVPDKGIGYKVLEALCKQKIILKIKKKRGWKYYLNKERQPKIDQIRKEKGRPSIIPLLLCLK